MGVSSCFDSEQDPGLPEALTSMPPTCGDCCCPKDCLTEQCGCKCGETICSLGAFFFVAACGFWVVGELVGVLPTGVYHKFNLFWFHLAFVFMIFGALYAFYVRGKSAFAREAEDEEDADKDAPETAPTPYVMLAAEP